MATATQPTTHVNTAPKPAQIVPIKVGWFGGQGAGKTTSAAMLSLALSVELHNRAPVWVTDTEPGWQFLKPLFAMEKVEMVQRTVPTFKAMLKDLRDAEKAGACVWAGDSLTIIWQELMQSFKARNNGRIPINAWGDIKALWGEYTTLFLNANMHCFALGRLGNVMEEIQDEKTGESKLTKVGTAFKAGGSESFGYEPHLLLELSLERKAKVKAGSRIEGEGRMVHRVDVLKDRTWALNGQVIRWSDKMGYKPGDYKNVWNSLKPHFDRVQQTMALVKIESGQSSLDLIAEDGNSDWYHKKQLRDACANEITETLDHLFGGASQEAKHVRRSVTEKLFGIISKDNVDKLQLTQMERGLRILQSFGKRAATDRNLLGQKEDAILSELDKDIGEYDRGEAEISDMPF